MNEQEFINALQAELKKHSAGVVEKWKKVLSILPDETKAVEVIISPTQDGDGIFDIFVSLDGPDLYVLNKKIRDHFQLFSPVHTSDGVDTYIPEVDPFDVDFEVNDVVVDTVMPWLEGLWAEVSAEEVSVPVCIYGEEGYGSRPSAQLC
jgi:hypothetical protein